MNFYGRQIRLSVPVEIRDGKIRIDSRRRIRRVSRRRVGAVHPAGYAQNKTENQKGFRSGPCCSEAAMDLREHKLQREARFLALSVRSCPARIPLPARNLSVLSLKRLRGTNGFLEKQLQERQAVAPLVSQNASRRFVDRFRSCPPQSFV